MEENGRDYFSNVPIEVLENIVELALESDGTLQPWNKVSLSVFRTDHNRCFRFVLKNDFTVEAFLTFFAIVEKPEMATRRIALQIRWNKSSSPLENLLAAIHRFPDEASRIKMTAEFGRFLDTLHDDQLGQVASEDLCAALRPAEQAAEARFIDRILAYNWFSDGFKALCLDQCLLLEASRSTPNSFSRLEKLLVGYRKSYDKLDPHQAPFTDRFRSVVLAGAVPLFDLFWPGNTAFASFHGNHLLNYYVWFSDGESRGSFELFKHMFSLRHNLPDRLLHLAEWIFWRDCAQIAEFLLEKVRQGQHLVHLNMSLGRYSDNIAFILKRPEHDFREIRRVLQMCGVDINHQAVHFSLVRLLSEYEGSSDDVVFPIFVRLRRLALKQKTLPKLLHISQTLLKLEPRWSIIQILPRFLEHYEMYPIVSEP